MTPTLMLFLVRDLPGVLPRPADPGEGDEAGLASSLLPVVPHTGPARGTTHPGEGNQGGVLGPPSLVRVNIGSCRVQI